MNHFAGITFEPTVTLGVVAHAISTIVALVGLYYKMQTRMAIHEREMQMTNQRIAEVLGQLEQRIATVESDISEMKLVMVRHTVLLEQGRV